MLEENPLADFVELPEHLQDLRSCVSSTPPLLRIRHSWRRYSNIYCGVIKGALEMVNIRFASTSCLPPPPAQARYSTWLQGELLHHEGPFVR